MKERRRESNQFIRCWTALEVEQLNKFALTDNTKIQDCYGHISKKQQVIIRYYKNFSSLTSF